MLVKKPRLLLLYTVTNQPIVDLYLLCFLLFLSCVAYTIYPLPVLVERFFWAGGGFWCGLQLSTSIDILSGTHPERIRNDAYHSLVATHLLLSIIYSFFHRKFSHHHCLGTCCLSYFLSGNNPEHIRNVSGTSLFTINYAFYQLANK